jgi:hypothetical protein
MVKIPVPSFIKNTLIFLCGFNHGDIALFTFIPALNLDLTSGMRRLRKVATWQAMCQAW